MSSTRKLSELIGEYTDKNRNLKPMTLTRRKYIWGLLIKAIGDIYISDFGYCQAEDFQQWLYGRELSPSSVKSYRKAIQSMMRWCWRRGYRAGDPFDGLSQPRVAQAEIRIYSEAEVQAMLAAADRIWRARILAAVSAGLRKSEVQNLTVSDVNFERNYISVQSKKETAHTWRWSAKNYQVRRVPLTGSLGSLLAEIFTELPAGQPYLMLTERRYFGIQRMRAKGLMEERLRTTPDENVRPWRNILSATNIVGTFHDLRRTAITRWTWNMPAQNVKKLAGHADIATTMQYYAAVSSDVILRAANCSIA